MATRIAIDCVDSQPVADFWMAALAYAVGALDVVACHGTWLKLRDPKAE